MAKATTNSKTSKKGTVKGAKKSVVDTRFEVRRTKRPQDNADCFEIYFLDKPHKSVVQTLKAFATEGEHQMFHWCDWTGAWYATEKAVGGNIENVKSALTQALDKAPAKGQRINKTDALESQVVQLTALVAKLLEAQGK